MKKDLLRGLALLGVRARLTAIEAELRDCYREFPEAFAGPPVPFARPELKANGTGRWPIVATSSNGNGHHAPKPKKAAKRSKHQGAAKRIRNMRAKYGTAAPVTVKKIKAAMAKGATLAEARKAADV